MQKLFIVLIVISMCCSCAPPFVSNPGSSVDSSSEQQGSDTISDSDVDSSTSTMSDDPPCQATAPLTGKGVVTVQKSDDSWSLHRDGMPYFVKGVGGQANLDMAAAFGANSTRTWGSQNAKEVLDSAESYGMTVLLGIWLSHNEADFTLESYKNEIRSEVQTLLDSYKTHPALLMWALGNEINLSADTQVAWEFVEELAQLIKSQDSNHPVATVNSGVSEGTLNNIAQWAPSIEVLGVNSYRGIKGTDTGVNASNFAGPYMITEWGPNGHWEVENTSWGRPIEQTSDSKRASYLDRYQYIYNLPERCFGSYVFLWGQKQERTPSWYGLFAEELPSLGLNGESYPAADVMQYGWCGSWPANRAPVVTDMTVDGMQAEQNVTVTPGQNVSVVVTGTDLENDTLTYIWELLEEPSALGEGGSFEPRPATIEGAIGGTGPSVQLTAPSSGQYRIFVYVLDGKGHVGSANIPFWVN